MAYKNINRSGACSRKQRKLTRADKKARRRAARDRRETDLCTVFEIARAEIVRILARSEPGADAGTGYARHLSDALAPFEVAVPESWRRATRAGVVFPRMCFWWSLRFVYHLWQSLDGTDPTLAGLRIVHGQYLGGESHGWVELPGDVVFDGPNQRFYRRADYYRVLRIRPFYRYELPAILYLMPRLPMFNDYIWYGDWHRWLGLPVEPEAPRTVTRGEAVELTTKAGLKLWALHDIVTVYGADLVTEVLGR